MKYSMEELLRVVNENKGNLARMKKELKKLLKQGTETDDIILIGGVSYYFALIGFTQGQRTSFFPNAYKAASMLGGSTEYTMAARCFNLLGIAYVAQENYQLALESYNKSLQTIRDHRSCRFTKDTVLSNIAECYSKMGEYRRSIGITSECLRIARKKTPEAFESFTIYGLNLSEYYENIGDLENAGAILDEVADDAAKVEESNSVTGYFARRAVVAYKSGDGAKGAEYADKVIQAVAEGRDSYELHPDFEKIVICTLNVRDFDRAKKFADILMDYAASSGHTIDAILAKRVLAEYYMAVGQNDTALELYRELNTLYQKRMGEEKAMQYAVQRKVDKTNKEVKKLMEKIRLSEQKAEKDPLTKLMNRAALVRTANEFVEAARAKGLKLGGIFIDIDFFKEYNDTYGHAMGDEVIKQVANACLTEESSTAKFARYGGDEFFGIVLGAKDADLARIASRICAVIRSGNTEHRLNPNGQIVTVSVGVVNIDMRDSGNTIIDVINCADKALYYSKRAGKNSIYEIDHTDMTDASYRKLEF